MMSYSWKRKPRKHQLKALQACRGREAFAYLMGMRVGKSKTLIDDWAHLVFAGRSKDLIIVAPAGVYATWEQNIADDLPDEILDNTLIYRWVSVDKKLRAQAEQFVANKKLYRIYIVNVEALSVVEDARDVCIQMLQQRKGVMSAVDESVIIKNHKAKRTKFVVSVLGALSKYRRILSGLPTPRSPLDAFSQFYFLDPNILGYERFIQFQYRYAIMKRIKAHGRMIDIVDGFQNLDELQEKIAAHSYRVRLEDCYDLPPRQYSKREVALTKEQARIYNDIKLNAMAQLKTGEHITAMQVITQMLRMHQVLCGHTKDENGVEHLIPEKRTEALLELLEDYDGKAIIWCNYDHDIRKVTAALEKEYGAGCTARFWGGNRDTRDDEIAVWRSKKAPQCRFIVATQSAGGRGQTWTEADLVVYYSNSYDLEHRMQSEERAQGVGKTTSVAYVDLVVPGTVDEVMIEALRAKINMAAAIIGDEWREWLI
jgi:SNF2 family DNA or RNA helicase